MFEISKAMKTMKNMKGIDKYSFESRVIVKRDKLDDDDLSKKIISNLKKSMKKFKVKN